MYIYRPTCSMLGAPKLHVVTDLAVSCFSTGWHPGLATRRAVLPPLHWSGRWSGPTLHPSAAAGNTYKGAN